MEVSIGIQLVLLAALLIWLLYLIGGSFKRKLGVLALALVFFAVFFTTGAGEWLLARLIELKSGIGATETVQPNQ